MSSRVDASVRGTVQLEICLKIDNIDTRNLTLEGIEERLRQQAEASLKAFAAPTRGAAKLVGISFVEIRIVTENRREVNV